MTTRQLRWRGRYGAYPGSRMPAIGAASGRGADADADAILPATVVAKWLIPSVTALFVAVGYVVELAQQELLGTGIDSAPSANYIASAAEFFLYLPTLLADSVMQLASRDPALSLNGHLPEFIVAALLSVLALLLPLRLRGSAPGLSRVIAPAILCVLVIGKFVMLDAPLGKINDAVVGVGLSTTDKPGTRGHSPWRDVDRARGRGFEEVFDRLRGQNIYDRLLDATHGLHLQGQIATRASGIWHNFVCSRINTPALTAPEEIESANKCTAQRNYQARVDGEFVAQSIASTLVIAIAFVVMREKSVAASVIAILALVYGLTWPYAYGKLEKKTNFEYGLVDFAIPDLGAAAPAKADKPAAPANATQHAIVLSRDLSSITLLVASTGACPALAGQAPASQTEVKLWAVPLSQVRAIREISREDVITWKTLTEHPCPDGAANPNK